MPEKLVVPSLGMGVLITASDRPGYDFGSAVARRGDLAGTRNVVLLDRLVLCSELIAEIVRMNDE
jgi:hypothetical protein